MLNHVLMNLPSSTPTALGYGPGPNSESRPPPAESSALICPGVGGGKVYSPPLQIHPTPLHSSIIETYDLVTLLRNPHVAQLFRKVQELEGQLQTAHAQLRVAGTQVFNLSQIRSDLIVENCDLRNTIMEAQNQRMSMIAARPIQ